MMNTRYAALITFSLLSSLAWSAPAPKPPESLWLKTDSRWTRTDSYGMDRNHNGVIDENEWVHTSKTGNARNSKPWNNVRPLREGETHRWEVQWEDTFESEPTRGNLRV